MTNHKEEDLFFPLWLCPSYYVETINQRNVTVENNNNYTHDFNTKPYLATSHPYNLHRLVVATARPLSSKPLIATRHPHNDYKDVLWLVG